MTSRFLRLTSLAGALALLPAIAHAQDSKPISVGVMGGLSLPTGDLGDFYDSGFNITGNVYFVPGASRLMFRGDVGYNSFGAKIGSSDLSVLSVTGNVIFSISAMVDEGGIRPYLIAGGGLYRTSAGDDSESDLGINVGGGVEFRLAGFSTFAEARFVNIFGEGDFNARYIPVTFGVRF